MGRAPLTLLLAAIAMVAMGQDGCETDGGGPNKEERAAEKAERLAVEADACGDQLAPLLDSLSELNSRLSVGVVFADYTTYVGDARIAYDKTPFQELSPTCINRWGLKAERAMNMYVQAGNEWSDCIGDIGCDVEALNLSEKWARAGRLAEQARP